MHDRPRPAAVGRSPLLLATAIVVAATTVFILAGAAPRSMTSGFRRLQVGYAIAVIALVLVAVPLTLRSVTILGSSTDANLAAPLVRAWLGDRQLVVTDYAIDGSQVSIGLTGSDEPPSAAPLAASLSKALARPIGLTVDYAPTIREHVTGTP